METSDSLIRTKFREHLKLNRITKRTNEIDSKRIDLNEIEEKVNELENVTEKDIIGLASRIKRRRHADGNDLKRLSNGFLQNKENIVKFVNITGALNIVTKMLIGNDTKLQILACECLCNLSLGDEFCSEKIALNCGSYLFTYLNDGGNDLCVICLWTLANLSASGIKPLKIILSLKVISKIVSLIETNSNDLDFLLKCVQTLEAVIEYGRDAISTDETTLIIKEFLSLQKLSNEIRLQLIYKTLSNNSFDLIESLIAPLIDLTINNLLKFGLKTDKFTTEDTLSIIFTIRILGNLFANYYEISIGYLNDIFRNNSLSFFNDVFIKFIKFTNEIFWKEFIWFCGNVYQNENFEMIIRNYIKNI